MCVKDSFRAGKWMVWIAVLAVGWSLAGPAVARGAVVYAKRMPLGPATVRVGPTPSTRSSRPLMPRPTATKVWVAAGTYVENITLKSGVALYGGFAGNETDLSQRNWAANKTILDGNQSGSVVTSPEGAPQPPGSTALPFATAVGPGVQGPQLAAGFTAVVPP